MKRQGIYTGIRVYSPNLDMYTTVGLIFEINGDGIPVYELLLTNKEYAGQMTATNIRKYLRLYYTNKV